MLYQLHGAYLSANLTKAIAEMIQKLVHIFAPGKSELDYGRELFNTLDDSVRSASSTKWFDWYLYLCIIFLVQ